jgi:hypothetical protein
MEMTIDFVRQLLLNRLYPFVASCCTARPAAPTELFGVVLHLYFV